MLWQPGMEELLWQMLVRMQGQTFATARGLTFTYTIHGGELFVDRKSKSITQATVFMAYRTALRLGAEVTGPKKLGTFGASYLYPIFQRLYILP
jgi:hypothetical protein